MSGLRITLASGSDEEARVRDALLRLRTTHDVARFEITQEVRIEEGAVPHSHPTLTLSTRYVDDNDPRLLSTYVHEQMHWWSMASGGTKDARAKVFEHLAKDFNLPTDPPEGCGSQRSNEIHLYVCWLEYSALCEFWGQGDARAFLAGKPYYRAVYRTILGDISHFTDLFESAQMGLPQRT